MKTIDNEQMLVTTTNPDTWSGDGLRGDAYRMAKTMVAFNHATLNRHGILSDVKDLGSIVGSLERIIDALPQLLSQLGTELDRAHDAGYIDHSRQNVDTAVAAAKLGLRGAADNTKLLKHHLHQAFSVLDFAYPTDAFDDAKKAAGTDDESWED